MQLSITGIRLQSLVAMKLLILFTIIVCLQVSARSLGQTVTLSLDNAPLEKAFTAIQQQTRFSFVYTRAQLKNTLPVTCNIKDADLTAVLEVCFRNQPLTFFIEDHYVIVQTKKTSAQPPAPALVLIGITGKVTNENGEPMDGVTIVSKLTGKTTFTNPKGEFILPDISTEDILVITYVGYHKEEILVNKQNYFPIQLRIAVGTLDETIVMAYGKTSRRLNTGNIGKVSAEEIGRQPVSNVLAALHGRIPGLTITQTTGVPGGKFNVQIRGRNSIAQGSEPLFIIDGVPFASNNNNLNLLTSALSSFQEQGLSPFNSINLQDIESIEVLKDADATAIYGSRGANGVILITTKKGASGKTNFSASVSTGLARVTKTATMLNTQQYLQIRREAFKNDITDPDIFSAPDLLVWDTTRYTDFKKDFIGKTAKTTDVQLTFSGGNINTQFRISGTHHYESTVFPGDLKNEKSSVHFNINHASPDQNLKMQFSGSYNSDQNILPLTDYTSFLTLPPNLPSLYDSAGKLNWEIKGVPFDNPNAYLHQKYVSNTENLLSNLQLSYRIVKGLTGKISLGYNSMLVDEKSTLPKAAQNPINSPTGSAIFGSNRFTSWIIEPQLEYTGNINKGKLTFLVGGTWQQILNNRTTIQASGYTNDALLGSVDGAANTLVSTGYNQYKYEAVFGRLNYNWRDKYIINFTGRRDGSSRFGPDKRFANFLAGGIAWIFSGEELIEKNLPFISFGKLRVSYGSTGNDQIGDYKYLDLWTSLPNRYQGASVIPTRLSNADYSWEINRKFEVGADLGFSKDRILFSASYFLNRSSNQLVDYRLPGQTGFISIIRNFPAIIENKGLELTVTSKNIAGNLFKWTTAANITIPKNKLVSFPGIASSGYSKIHQVGKSLNTVYGYHLLGVDAATGVYQFEDVNKDGLLGLEDYSTSYNLDPKFYGGLNNIFEYKKWELSFFFEFKKQIGLNYNNYAVYNFTPGTMYNLPSIFLNRWQNPGDNSSIQQFTQTFTPAFDGQYYFSNSDGRFSDASYIRLKNISLSYSPQQNKLKKICLKDLRLYLLVQNLFTITSYKGADPETQNLFVLPPLKTFTAGIQLTF